MTSDADPTPPRRRTRLGTAALVVAIAVAAAPLVTWIVVGVVAAIDPPSRDEALYVGLIGGFIIASGVAAVLAPLAVAAVVLGVVSLIRGGRRAPGVAAIILGAIGSLGLLWLPYVLAELTPDW